MEDKEIWKDIKGYEGLYQVSNLENVKSVDRVLLCNVKNQYGIYPMQKLIKGKVLKQVINGAGYYQVCLYQKGHKKYNMLVHRLIAEAFIPNIDNKQTINHIDGNRTNNSLDNLEWATMQEQQIHRNYILNHKSLINDYCRKRQKELHQRKVIRDDGLIFNSIKEASKGNETLRKHINEVCRGKRNYADGYKWQYAD